MAALPAGVQYGLSSEPNGHNAKDLVFVKLTDSALRSIEEFIRNMGKIGTTPTIQFLPGDIGKISIPNGTNGAPVTFRFSLSNNAEMEGPQGSFECLEGGSGSSRDSGRKLRTLGSLPNRMRILANDDVYEATKQRMTIDAENLKSKCTRVIKPNQTGLGRKVKVKHVQQQPPLQRVVPPAPVTAAAVPPAAHTHPHQSRPLHQPPNTGGAGAGGTSSYGSHHSVPPSSVSQHHQPRPQPQQHHQTQSKAQPSANTDLLRRPIKERLIQLLALKPYKKPELYARINSEGVKEKERSVIKTILQQISSMKDNCYILHRHLWNDVNEDWPFYSQDEKQTLKRRKPQNLTPPLSSDSGHSPSPPPAGHKRSAPALVPSPSPCPASPSTAVLGGAQQPPVKKQRISHYRRPQPQLDNTIREGSGSPAGLSNGYHSSTSMSSGERKSYSDEDTPAPQLGKRENGYLLNFGTAKNFLGTPPKQNDYETSPVAEFASPDKGAISPVESNGGSARIKSPDSTTRGGAVTPSHDFPDYHSEYTEIRCPEQRRKYKAEFATQYEEYRILHSRVEAVTQLFTRLEERLREEPQDGPTHREIKRQIVMEYHKTQRDTSYQRDMAQFKYLHLKLAHIKQLVLEYDSQQPPSSAPAPSPPTTVLSFH